MNEIVYVLINESMPGYVKIGRTTDLKQRIRSLDNTSVPLPFECFYACLVKDAAFVEKQIHEGFSDSRVRSNREFFEIGPERIIAVLKLVEIEHITPDSDFIESEEDKQALNKARRHKSSFNFRLADIPVGSEIVYIRDESVIAKVVDEKQIDINGEITSVSAAASRLLDSKWPVCGTRYWKYEGETLDERRNRLNSE